MSEELIDLDKALKKHFRKERNLEPIIDMYMNRVKISDVVNHFDNLENKNRIKEIYDSNIKSRGKQIPVRLREDGPILDHYVYNTYDSMRKQLRGQVPKGIEFDMLNKIEDVSEEVDHELKNKKAIILVPVNVKDNELEEADEIIKLLSFNSVGKAPKCFIITYGRKDKKHLTLFGDSGKAWYCESK